MIIRGRIAPPTPVGLHSVFVPAGQGGCGKVFAKDKNTTYIPAPLARVRGLRSDLIDPAIAAHHGRIVKRHDELEFKIEMRPLDLAQPVTAGERDSRVRNGPPRTRGTTAPPPRPSNWASRPCAAGVEGCG
jgi:hypothetical protein